MISKILKPRLKTNEKLIKEECMLQPKKIPYVVVYRQIIFYRNKIRDSAINFEVMMEYRNSRRS